MGEGGGEREGEREIRVDAKRNTNRGGEREREGGG
jgi:hypothetical protein